MAGEGYDPDRSRLNEDTLADFLRAPLTGIINEIPGIGAAAIKKLADNRDGLGSITNTFQLLGKFLLLKTNGEDNEPIDCVAHCDAFWYWLKEKGISSYRSGIVLAVAEKANTMIPGIYDASHYDKE